MVPNVSSKPNKDSQKYIVYYDWSGSAKLSTVLVHALADLMGINATEAERMLYESIDPESLNGLFKWGYDGHVRSDGHVSFTVNGYAVTITAEGRIEIVSIIESRPTDT